MLYLDYAATTPVRPEVQQEMANYFAAQFANPHSPHDAGLAAKAEVEGARRRIATVLGIWPRQIVFTSGGTEANNLAVFGLARAARKNGKRVLTTAIEHKSVLSPIEALTREGFNADLLPVDSYGTVDLAGIDNKLTADTLLIALAHANNEIGTIQPISKIAGLIRDKSRGKKIYLHCDAVQSFGKIPVQFAALGVDTLTISGHKIYGPKGIGVLIIAPGVRLEPLMFGGDQERGLRPGTLNVPAVMGLAKAVELAAAELDRESSRQNVLCKLALRELLQLEGVYLNGHPDNRLPNNINLGIKGIEGQVLVAEMAARGIAVSAGSACSSGSVEPSHVLLGIGQSREQAYECLRITIGRDTSRSDMEQFIAAFATVKQNLAGRFLT